MLNEAQYRTLRQAFTEFATPAQLNWLERHERLLHQVERQRLFAASLELCETAWRELGTAEPGGVYSLILRDPTPTEVRLGQWCRADLAIALLLLRAAELAMAPPARWLTKLFEAASEPVRASCLKLLLLTDPAGELADWSIEMGLQPNFPQRQAALFCHNPYPALHFPQAAFNQLVLAALTAGANLLDLQNLEPRLDASLSLTVAQWLQQRREANASLTPSLWLAIRPIDLDETGSELFKAALCDSDESQRFYAALALSRNGEVPEPLLRLAALRENDEPVAAIRRLLRNLSRLAGPRAGG